ncbi:H/ACA RNA-protein complex protein Gar1 [Methanocella sp. CWC-04]|uniref:H/ACA RNA-protein complex protein Gar1 n=1 Tax=Methanooceanicella nereidis TaxID=2052831 RepID=A0AAP2RH78_9EURY|nr:Gar1/Naf1 family protein [Methanocella sp. CWC-04]MCD1296162.1 H/ACA RNA-protein complex protein Gar1 [Methanocella sp. CWC-04]
MKRLGIVSHLSAHGYLIVRSEDSSLPRINAKIVNKKMDRIGTVYDVFGPEKSPYISIKLDRKMTQSGVQALMKERVYVA